MNEISMTSERESERERGLREGKLEKKRLVQPVRQKLRTMGQKPIFFNFSDSLFFILFYLLFSCRDPAGQYDFIASS